MLGARALEPRKLGEALGPRGHWSAGKDFEPEITLIGVGLLSASARIRSAVPTSPMYMPSASSGDFGVVELPVRPHVTSPFR